MIKERRRWLGQVEVVKLVAMEEEPQHQPQLRKLLIDFLSYLQDQSRESYEPWSLGELLEAGLRFKIE